MKEIWKSVKNYEGLYEVSNFGNVRSVDRVVNCNDGRKCLFKGRILKPAKVGNRYLQIQLWKSGKVKKALIHRLVAEAFIPNSDNLPQVNHKDEVKVNNHVSNLEWCDGKYNSNYGTRNKRRAEKLLNSPKLSKSVLQIDLEKDAIISEYPSAMEAARQTEFGQGNISNCCKGKRKTAYGFKWRYKE